MKKLYPWLCIVLLCWGCSIDKWAINKVADVLAADNGSLVFTGDDDPVLVGQALPFALKLYESLLESTPENRQLLLATGKAYCLYAFAFVQTPAAYLPDTEYEKQEKMIKRAKNLFLRGRKYILTALDLKNPGFREILEKASKEEQPYLDFLKTMDNSDVPFLYWGATAWMGALTTDPFDMNLMISMPRAMALLTRVLELDEAYDRGGVHEIFLSYYGSLPESSGGSEEKARYHYKKALEYSGGTKASTYLSLATSVCVGKQYLDEFKKLLNIILDMDFEAAPEDRLLNEVAREKAGWLLDNLEIYFFIESSEDFEDDWNENMDSEF